MDSKTFKEFKKRAQHSVKVNQMLRDGIFWNDKALVDELMDDSILHEKVDTLENKRYIGDRFQAVISDMGIKSRLR